MNLLFDASKDRGKLILDQYDLHYYDRDRKVDRIFAAISLTTIGITGITFAMNIVNDWNIAFFLLGVAFLGATFIIKVSDHRECIRLYEKGIAAKVLVPRGGGSHWDIGVRFIPYDDIVGVSLSFNKFLELVWVQWNGKRACVKVADRGEKEVKMVLKGRLGERWKNISRIDSNEFYQFPPALQKHIERQTATRKN